MRHKATEWKRRAVTVFFDWLSLKVCRPATICMHVSASVLYRKWFRGKFLSFNRLIIHQSRTDRLQHDSIIETVMCCSPRINDVYSNLDIPLNVEVETETEHRRTEPSSAFSPQADFISYINQGMEKKQSCIMFSLWRCWQRQACPSFHPAAFCGTTTDTRLQL